MDKGTGRMFHHLVERLDGLRCVCRAFGDYAWSRSQSLVETTHMGMEIDSMTNHTTAERIVNVVHGKLLFHTADGYDTICTCIGEPYVTQIVKGITTALAEAKREAYNEGYDDGCYGTTKKV